MHHPDRRRLPRPLQVSTPIHDPRPSRPDSSALAAPFTHSCSRRQRRSSETERTPAHEQPADAAFAAQLHTCTLRCISHCCGAPELSQRRDSTLTFTVAAKARCPIPHEQQEPLPRGWPSPAMASQSAGGRDAVDTRPFQPGHTLTGRSSSESKRRSELPDKKWGAFYDQRRPLMGAGGIPEMWRGASAAWATSRRGNPSRRLSASLPVGARGEDVEGAAKGDPCAAGRPGRIDAAAHEPARPTAGACWELAQIAGGRPPRLALCMHMRKRSSERRRDQPPSHRDAAVNTSVWRASSQTRGSAPRLGLAWAWRLCL